MSASGRGDSGVSGEGGEGRGGRGDGTGGGWLSNDHVLGVDPRISSSSTPPPSSRTVSVGRTPGGIARGVGSHGLAVTLPVLGPYRWVPKARVFGEPIGALFLRVRTALTSTAGRRPDHPTRCHGHADITRDVTGHPTRCYTRTPTRVWVGPVLSVGPLPARLFFGLGLSRVVCVQHVLPVALPAAAPAPPRRRRAVPCRLRALHPHCPRLNCGPPLRTVQPPACLTVRRPLRVPGPALLPLRA